MFLCHHYGGEPRGVVPFLAAALPPKFGLLKMLFLEHHSTARQQTMMEKGIITFVDSNLNKARPASNSLSRRAP